MKNQIITTLIMVTVSLASCGESEESTTEAEDLTFDQKVEKVCDCFEEKSAAGEAPKDCFMLQGEFETTVGEDRRVEFIQATNQCAN